mmetsp:Transcript_29712/g.76731  ORF Transcript_29712/g.76731 Transcript_29712/m.76731 type:complete len:114 (-) Transcript_29712:1609-1950(-)
MSSTDSLFPIHILSRWRNNGIPREKRDTGSAFVVQDVRAYAVLVNKLFRELKDLVVRKKIMKYGDKYEEGYSYHTDIPPEAGQHLISMASSMNDVVKDLTPKTREIEFTTIRF